MQNAECVSYESNEFVKKMYLFSEPVLSRLRAESVVEKRLPDAIMVVDTKTSLFVQRRIFLVNGLRYNESHLTSDSTINARKPLTCG